VVQGQGKKTRRDKKFPDFRGISKRGGTKVLWKDKNDREVGLAQNGRSKDFEKNDGPGMGKATPTALHLQFNAGIEQKKIRKRTCA